MPRTERMTAPRIWNASGDIAQDIRRNLGPALAQQEQGWLLYRYRQDPRPTLDLYVDPRGRARMTVARRKDGTISARQGREDLSGKEMFAYHNTPALEVEKETAEKLVSAALRTPAGRRAISPIIAMEGCSERIGTAARETAQTVLQEAVTRADRNGRGVTAEWKRRVSRINDVLRKRLLDPRALHLAEAIRQQTSGRWDHVTFQQYNRTLLNLEAFDELFQEAPHILILHEKEWGQDPLRVGNAGQIAARVRKALDLPPMGWKLFTRCGSPRHRWTTLHDMTLAYRVLAQANRPDAPEETVRRIAAMDSHHRFNHGGWDHGDPQAAWVHIINQALAEDRSNIPTHLALISDTLRHHVVNQLPWGRTDWDSYVRRADRWHEEQTRKRLQDGRTERWESALGPTRAGEFDAAPVTTGGELIDLGASMKNCLGSYVQHCAAGTDRIFTLHQEDRLIAAAQIFQEDGAWRVGQIEGPAHARTSGRVQAAVQQLCQAYGQADARRDSPEEHGDTEERE